MKQYTISTRVRGVNRSARTNSLEKAESTFVPFFNAFLKDMFPEGVPCEKGTRTAFFNITVRVDEYSNPDAAPAETF